MRDPIANALIHFWVIVRHRWIMLLSAVLISAIGWTVVHLLPDKYEVSTQIHIDTQTVLRPILDGLAIDNTARYETALMIRRTLLTRSILEKIIYATDLHTSVTTPEEMDALIDKLVVEISVAPVSFEGANRHENVFEFRYAHTDPRIAKGVVDSLLNAFVERFMLASRKDAERARQFLEEKINEYEAKLEAAEDRLKRFKLNNFGAMPEEGRPYFTRLGALETVLAETSLQLRETEDRAGAIRKQLNAFVKAVRSGKESDVIAVTTPLDARVQELQARLDGLLLQYTDRHPDVIITQRALVELLKKRDQQQEQMNAGELDADLALLQSQGYQDLKVLLGNTEAQAAGLRVRVQEYEKRLAEMRRSKETMPKVEAELAKLNRDYEIIRSTYETLVARRQAAQISSEAERIIDGTIFKVITPAGIPSTPTSPNRILLASFVFAGAIVGGALIAWLWSQLNPAFYTRRQLNEAIPLPLLGTVSRYVTPEDVRRRYASSTLFVLFSICLIASYGNFLVNHGLDPKGLQQTVERMFKRWGIASK